MPKTPSPQADGVNHIGVIEDKFENFTSRRRGIATSLHLLNLTYFLCGDLIGENEPTYILLFPESLCSLWMLNPFL